MPTVELDLKQLVRAVHQLNAPEFKQFLQELSDLSRLQWARDRDEKALRAAVNARLPARKQRRLKALLDKGNAGTLTRDEDEELKALIDEVEQGTLEKAEAMDELLQRGVDLRPETVLERCNQR